MSAVGPAVAGALTGAVAIALTRRRNRPPRWLRPSTSAAEGYAAIMATLEARQSYPLRHRLLTILNERAGNPEELAREVDTPLPDVNHHVRSLLDAGSIEVVGEDAYRAVEIASHSDDAWAALSRSHQSWVPLELDERGFNEVAEVLEHALDAILAIRDRSQARIESGSGEVYLDSEVVIAHFVRGCRTRPGPTARL